MIKLDRPVNIPQVLQENSKDWTKKLLDLIDLYGSFSKIPKVEKDKALKHYRHKDIRNILFESSYRKCAFCEGFPEDNSSIEIEHFHPKSLYPHETFYWENFLPCCGKCNSSKGAHDTKSESIINPYIDNPEEHLEFESRGLRIKGKDSIGLKTIEVFNLNSTRMYRPYSELFVQFHQYEDDLSTALQDYKNKNTPIKKRNQLKRIKESIERLEVLMDKKSKYSFFCSSYISSSKPYIQAKKLISSIVEDF